MEPIDEFWRAVAGVFLALFLATIVRLVRPFHVPAQVNGWNPFGRKFDEAAAMKQNRFCLRMCLAAVCIFALYGVGALCVAVLQAVR